MKGEKERSRRKRGGEEKKAVVALLVFIMATLELLFWPKKKLLDAKGPFGGNVFKNPARYINIDKHVHKRIKLFPTKLISWPANISTSFLRETLNKDCDLFSRGVIFTRARVSLALLSLRKNGGLLVVYCEK